MPAAFAALLRQLQHTHYPASRKAFADALGMHQSRLYRAMNPNSPAFDFNGCMRLAEVTGADLIVVLRAAGRQRVADVLSRLVAGPIKGHSDARRRLAALCDELDDAQVVTVSNLIEVVVRLNKASRPNRKTRAALSQSTDARTG